MVQWVKAPSSQVDNMSLQTDDIAQSVAAGPPQNPEKHHISWLTSVIPAPSWQGGRE